MANEIVRFALSDAGATAALGVNVTDAEIQSKRVQGPLGLLVRGGTQVGGVAADKSGNLYITDSAQHVILKVTEAGEVTTVAGLAGTSGNNTALMDVANTTARFNTPRGIAVDNSGRVYVCDSGNNQIRVIEGGTVSLVAGNGSTTSGFADGVGGDATFNTPWDIAVDNSGTLWVSDFGNNSIRRIKGGTVLTFAGSQSGDGENVATTTRALFNGPRGIAVNARGDLFVCDSGNLKIKKIDPRGWVYLHSGSGSAGRTLGTFSTSSYFQPWACSVDESDTLYLIDLEETGNSRLVRVNARGIPAVIADFNGSTFGDDLVDVVVTPSQKIMVVMSDEAQEAYSSSSSSIDSSSSSSI